MAGYGGWKSIKVLKNRASRRDPALCIFCKCSHMTEYASLSKSPHALADGLMLVFQHPVKYACGPRLDGKPSDRYFSTFFTIKSIKNSKLHFSPATTGM
jgi:hypothetical protein